MATKRNPILVCALSVFLALLCECRGREDKGKKEQESPTSMPVRTWMVEPGRVEKALKITGDIRAGQEAKMAPLSPGRIKRIPVREGQRVKAGDLLVRMDDKSLAPVEADYRRSLALKESGSMTPSNFEKVKAQYLTLKENTFVRAPFAGWVGSIHARDGEVYNGMGSIMTLHDLSSVRILCRVTEQDLPLVQENMKVRFEVAPYKGRAFWGKIKSVNRTAEGLSRSYGIEITAKNPKEVLKPGMFARCEIILEERQDVIAVPTDAVLDDGKIFVVQNDTACARQVKIGLSTPVRTEVIDGLMQGEELIVEGNYGLINGSRIQRIVE